MCNKEECYWCKKNCLINEIRYCEENLKKAYKDRYELDTMPIGFYDSTDDRINCEEIHSFESRRSKALKLYRSMEDYDKHI